MESLGGMQAEVLTPVVQIIDGPPSELLERLSAATAELIPHYGADCPVAVVWRATWPDQRIIRATLATLKALVPEEVERTALILVGPSLAQEGFEESRLYAGDYDRRYRPVGTHPRFPGTGG